MLKLNQRGVVHLFMLLVLATGLVAGVYLVTGKDSLKLFSRAAVSSPISLKADLIPTDLQAPSTAKPGQIIPVTMTIKNQGNKNAVSVATTSAWEDRVFLSTDQTYDSTDTYLGKFKQTAIVPAGGSYTATVNAPLSGKVSGNYYLILRVDNYNDVAESDNNNNQKVVPITISTSSVSPSPTPAPSAASSKRVFVTSTTYNGNLGGLPGADASCQARANATNLGGAWKAWLSSTYTSAASRMTHNTGPYKLINGTIIANNWDDLIAGSLQSPINVSEYGRSLMATPIWSNATKFGEIKSTDPRYTCGDSWVSTTYGGQRSYGWAGSGFYSSGYWTEYAFEDCGGVGALYCFEQ